MIMSEVDTSGWAGQQIATVGGMALVWPASADQYTDPIHLLNGYGCEAAESLRDEIVSVGGAGWDIDVAPSAARLMVSHTSAFTVEANADYGFTVATAAVLNAASGRWEAVAQWPWAKGILKTALTIIPSVGGSFSFPSEPRWFQNAALALRRRGAESDADDVYAGACLEDLDPGRASDDEWVAWMFDEHGHVIRVWITGNVPTLTFEDTVPGRAAAVSLGFVSLAPTVFTEGGISYQRSELPSPHILINGYRLRRWERSLNQLSAGATSLAGVVGALELGQHTQWRAEIFSRGPAQGAADEQHLLRPDGFFSRAGVGATITVCPDAADLRRATDTPGQGHTRLLNPDYVGRAGRRICQRSNTDAALRMCDYSENEIEYRALHELMLTEVHDGT